jgi:hypothetical protein
MRELYKLTDKIIVLDILIFTFHAGNDKANDYELNDNKNSPDLNIITCKG